jgi:hypothetical protein
MEGFVKTQMTRVCALVLVLTLAFATAFGAASWAARVIPNRLDLAQAPGTTETYTLLLESDQAASEEVRLYLGDWKRTADGEHDWGIPVNGGRWTFDRSFAAGGVVTIQYEVAGADGGLAMDGSFRTGIPQVTGAIAGVCRLDGSTTQAGAAGATVIVTRSVEGRIVTLRVETHVDVQGLVLMETYSGPVELSSLDAAGGRFDTVERSCTSWIGVSESVVQLAPGERRDVALTITTPDAMNGSYWSSLFVEAQPEIIEQGGTRILSIPRTAIKIFVTAPGTEVLAGKVSSVSVLGTAPLAATSTFENEGNVELVVSGQLEIVDRTGTVVRQTAIEEFKVLPGSARVVSISESAEVAGLPSGIYQAVVRLDYGGDGPVVGVRGFRVP